MSEFSEEEFVALKAAYESEKLARLKLEEECDLLAFENDRLTGELARLTAIVSTHRSLIDGDNKESLNVSSTCIDNDVEIFIEGDNKFANEMNRKILDANGGKNVLCSGFLVDGNDDILLSGGVDGALNGFDTSGFRLFSCMLTAPVLAMDVNDLTIACSLMDGGHAVIQLSSGDYDSKAVTMYKDHSKYVVAIKFSTDGVYLATASHDKSVNVYQINTTTGDYDKLKTIQFTHTPESILFVPSHSAEKETELIIGLRDTVHLIYLNCHTFEQRHVSLNENDWDLHVSYTPLHLSASPDGRLLLIATDKSLHFVVTMGTNKRVRTLAGHTCGDYGKPIVSWDCTGRYIYCNSDEDSAVYVYSLASERIVHKLTGGHKAIVRGVACHPSKRLVLTASYDKSIVLWDRQ